MNIDAVNGFIGQDWVYIKNDCWSVFRRAIKAIFDIDVSEISVPHVSNPAYNKALFERESMRSKWQKTQTPSPGCAALFKDRRGRPVHIGLYVENGNILHCPGTVKSPGRTVYDELKELKKIYKSIEFYQYVQDNNHK